MSPPPTKTTRETTKLMIAAHLRDFVDMGTSEKNETLT
jgi:hypothetical protein